MKEDAQIDEIEKQKLKMIEDWDVGVEKYDAEDLTVVDTRYFMKNRDDIQPEKYNYREEKELKKVDHKNRNKTQTKERFLNLSEKTNVVITRTPNNCLEIGIKALGFNFEIAEFLEKNRNKMRQIFNSPSEAE